MPQPGPHVRRALSSSGWLVGERLISLGLSFVVSILLARYLGPNDFGALSYSLAFILLLATIPALGFGPVVVKDLVRHPHRHDETIGVVIYLKLAAAVLAFLMANAIAQIVVTDATNRLLIFLMSFSLLFEAVVGLRLHFEALTEARPVVAIASSANILGALARVVAIALAAPLWLFAAIVSVQAALAAAGYAAIYRRSVARSVRLAFSGAHARELLGESWPLIISGVAATVYLKVDQFMLGQMRGMSDVGIYAIAARLSEVWYVLPMAIVSSAFPRLIELRSTDARKYRRRMQESVRYLFWIGIAIALSIALISQPLITLLFGYEYQTAGTILAIHVWACPAVFMGMAIEKWLVAEGALKFIMGRQIAAAIANVCLNLVLIPRYGGIGAAVATVVCYTLAYYLSCFGSRRTRDAAIWMTKAILWPIEIASRRLRRATSHS